MHKLSHIFFTPLYFNNFAFAFPCVRETHAGNFPVLPPLRPLFQSTFTAPPFAREKSAFSPFSFFSVARSFILEKIFGKAARRSGNAFASRIGRTACIARCTARHFQKNFSTVLARGKRPEPSAISLCFQSGFLLQCLAESRREGRAPCKFRRAFSKIALCGAAAKGASDGAAKLNCAPKADCSARLMFRQCGFSGQMDCATNWIARRKWIVRRK